MVRFFYSNGTRLAYRETGLGADTVILLHGWADRHERMLPLAARFGGRYRVISLDLRGHGLSEKTQGGYAIPSLAGDVIELCRQRDIRNPLIVGHSLGGAIALEIAASRPRLPRAVVALEGVILIPELVRAATKPLGEALCSPFWMDAMRGFVLSGFLPTDDKALLQAAMTELAFIPQHVHINIFNAMMGWDAERSVRNCKVPALYVDAGSGLSDLKKFQALCPQLVVGRTVGMGHNQMLATPEQVSAMIDRFTAVALKRQ